MHAASMHGTPILTSLPKDDELSCKVRPPKSCIWSLTSLYRTENQYTWLKHFRQNIERNLRILDMSFSLATSSSSSFSLDRNFAFLFFNLIDNSARRTASKNFTTILHVKERRSKSHKDIRTSVLKLELAKPNTAFENLPIRYCKEHGSEPRESKTFTFLLYTQ